MVDVSSSKNNESNDNLTDEFKVTPWQVEGKIDYNKLIERFGTQPITQGILDKVKKITREIHPMLKLQYFFSHRDFDWILDKYEEHENFYLYTGRGPSGMVHMGHLMPWMFTKYLQDRFGSNLIFQLTDDEKFLYAQARSMEEIRLYTYENILDIIATGFDAKKTRIVVDTKHIQYLYPIASEIAKRITFSTAKSVFGFSNSTNVGMIGFPPIQAAPCFLPSIIEGRPTPVLIPEVIEKKVSAAYTGGQATVGLQRLLGGNAMGCPVFWYLRYFFDTERESDERLLKCNSGNLLCGECKSDLAKGSKSFITNFK